MTGGYVGSILSWLASDKACDAFVGIGLVDADGVGIPVGGAEGWGACGGGDELFDACCFRSVIVPIKIACVCLLNKFGIDECDRRCSFCTVQCHNLVASPIITMVIYKNTFSSDKTR